MEPFLISAPQQLLGALEARQAYGLRGEDCHLIVIHRGDPDACEQIRRVARRWHWGEETWLSIDRPRRLLQWWSGYRQLNRLARRYRGADRVFAGFYRSLGMRHFVARTLPRNTVLLDDGLSTLSVPRVRRGDWSLTDHFPESRFRRLLKRVLNVGDQEFPTVEYFTIYDLATEESLRRHEFTSLRAELGAELGAELSPDLAAPPGTDRGRFRGSVFLGAPLVEDGYLSPAQYDRLLSIVFQSETSRNPAPLVYCAHRRESDARLEHIAELGFETERLELPIELEVVERGIPNSIGSFYSSALPNLAVLLQGSVPLRAYRLPSEMLTEVASARVDDCYQHFTEHFPSIEIVADPQLGALNSTYARAALDPS